MNVRSNVYGGKFCSPDERQIATLGTGFAANFISGGGLNRAGATLTNKRIYFSGEIFEFHGGDIISSKEQKIIAVRDVTGVGYAFKRNISALTTGIVLLIVIIGIFWLISYFLSKKTFFVVEYAGGTIAFETRWLQQNEQDNFIRNIHLAKDKLYSTAAAAQGFVGNDAEPLSDDNDEIDEVVEASSHDEHEEATEQYDYIEFDGQYDYIAQIRCPRCAVIHDIDYPKCPSCKHKYQNKLENIVSFTKDEENG